VSTALKLAGGGMLIDLKAYNTFAHMKKGLEQKLASVKEVPIGGKVSIDIGHKVLSNKQIRELEDTLLDYGLYLHELISTGPKGIEGDIEDEEQLIEGMPHYDDTGLICKHIRSGQKRFAQGNIVVLGDINPGAEVVAGGNILVMGSLRGMAHAGVFGDESAVVAAYRLNPTQLRIAAHITRPPDGEKYGTAYPEVARIRDGRVVIEKLKI